MSKQIYFQPQYVGKFICDASKCKVTCCERSWNIEIDAATYEKYSAFSSEFTAQFNYSESKQKYLLTKHPCPFLTEKKLCRLQLEHGEDFISLTCKNYPRVTNCFGKFFERSLTLTCPVAAELILFEREPMKFELVEVSENLDRILINPVYLDEKVLANAIKIQIALMSILQERTLTIDQRLIVLGFFLDRLDEIFSDKVFSEEALIKLIAAYESKIFLAEQVPRMIRSIFFDAKKFSAIMHDVTKNFHGEIKLTNNIRKIAANYEQLSPFRKIFLNEHSTFLENFLVNELFMNCYPWRFEGQIIKNFGVFIIKYKIFELILVEAALKKFLSAEDLISLTGWFTSQLDHVAVYHQKIFDYLRDKDDALNLMDSLLEG